MKVSVPVDTGNSSLDSYLRWDDISATDLVEVLFQIENATGYN